MSFFVLALLVFVSIVITEFYFANKISNSIKTLYKGISYKKIKTIKIIGLIYFNIMPLFVIGLRIYSSIAGERLSAPQGLWVDYLFIYPFWIMVMIMVQIMIFVIPIDLIRLVIKPFIKLNIEKVTLWNARFFGVLFIIFVIYVPARIIYDHNAVDARVIEYKKEGLPDSLKGFKIGLISDVQADKYTTEKRLDKFIEALNKEKPDLVLIAGDIITSTPNYIETAADALGKIEAKYGAFTCVGDHDNWAYRGDYKRSLREVTEALAEVGIPMVDNERLIFNVDSAKVGVTFVTDNYVTRVPRDLLDSLSNGKGDYDVKIFLTHQPNQYMIDAAKENDYDLFFAGHTHGGQITFLFPFFQPSVTHIETSYVRGEFWFDKMMMVVTPGLGMSLAPIRYNSTPEVNIIKLIGG